MLDVTSCDIELSSSDAWASVCDTGVNSGVTGVVSCELGLSCDAGVSICNTEISCSCDPGVCVDGMGVEGRILCGV